MARFAMLMRVEPAGRRALFRGKGYAAFTTRPDDALRPPIHFARDFQPVPVQRGLFRKRVMNVYRHRLPFA